tara:strand:+ start:6216 stop:7067 length:852 start_codon:yes stop_codon:yes gene_type:complete
MRILILGANGMFAKELIRSLKDSDFSIYGSSRSQEVSHENEYFKPINKVNVLNIESVKHAIEKVKPECVLNLVGITKYKKSSMEDFVQVNSLAPHQIAGICEKKSIRFIQISTDCVFLGDRGNYLDEDKPDAIDLYGRTKGLGEISYLENTLTVRTSFIGHNEFSKDGLLEWFLEQKESCSGYTTALYSGLTTVELSKVFKNYILNNTSLNGIFNVSGPKLSKYDLLKQISKIYKKEIKISESSDWIIDRSLDSKKFEKATGYHPPAWDNMIEEMYYKNKKNV